MAGEGRNRRTWGYWTQAKLQILARYLQAFATASKGVSERVYLDAFAGEGLGIDRLTGEEFKGSARIASDVADPAFTQALSSPDRHAWGQGRPGLINWYRTERVCFVWRLLSSAGVPKP